MEDALTLAQEIFQASGTKFNPTIVYRANRSVEELRQIGFNLGP